MTINEIGPQIQNEEPLSQRLSMILIETADLIRNTVMTEAQSLASVFPQLEVAGEVSSLREVGSIALGRAYHPVELVPGIIIESDHRPSAYKFVVLTPYGGLQQTNGVNKKGGGVMPRLRSASNSQLEEVRLWVNYGPKAADRLERLKHLKDHSLA